MVWNAKRKFRCIHRPGHIHDYAFAWAHDQTFFFLRFWKLLYLRLHLRNITNCITSAYWIIDLQKIWLPRTAKQWSELRPAHNWRHNLYHSWSLKKNGHEILSFWLWLSKAAVEIPSSSMLCLVCCRSGDRRHLQSIRKPGCDTETALSGEPR